MKSIRISLTLLASAALLAGCFVPVPLDEPTPEGPLEPTSTPTETPVWFPATATPSPFPTPLVNPTADLRPGVADLLVEDGFTDALVWATSSDADASAQVANGRLSLVLKSERSYLVSTRSSPILGDFYAEITAATNFCHGEDEYGLVVRAMDGDHFRFALSCDGRAKVDRFYNGGLTRQVGWVSSGAIPSLAPSSTRLAVWAAGSQMHFFVNDFYLFSVTDSQLFRGTVGAFVHTSGSQDVSVGFSDLKVWQVER
ncbi:MAG: hypothetical protein KIS88_10335 [Anaerolineales bacterium]|nr:hypothetical protein [Anaerolineales bacterium]